MGAARRRAANGAPATGAALDLPAPKVRAVQAAVLDWYRRSHRDLPWRATRDPYAILVSEVMLQQTQVERVLPKYHEFLGRYPTLAALAAAPRAEVIRTWAPLGYNLRAVRLHDVARQAVAQCGGRLPETLDGLLALKGIGRYTAAAVACFAYGRDEAVLDTNVRRVVGRVFADAAPGAQEDDRLAWRLAEAALPREAAACANESAVYDWNQALMDLGATLCTARAPRCLLCPAQAWCAARGNLTPGPFPTGEGGRWGASLPSGGAQPRGGTPNGASAGRRSPFGEPACGPRDGGSPSSGWAAGVRSAFVAETRSPYDTGEGTAPKPRPGRRPARRAARPSERFEGSRRWYRGRIVAALRALPPGGSLALAELGSRVKPDFAPADAPWLLDLARALARDGLVDLHETGNGEASLALPA